MRAVNPEAEQFDRVLEEVDRFSMFDASLQRDVLRARTGSLRDYDPLVAETNALDASLDRLRRIVPPGVAPASLNRLAAATATQEVLVEDFKSTNALLQNSLAYFAMFSFQLAASKNEQPWTPLVSALGGSMLRLSLNTSPEDIADVQGRLNMLAAETVAAGQADQVRALVAHARLLVDVLPKTDRILHDFGATQADASWRSLRLAVRTAQSRTRITARQFRQALYIVSLALVGLLAHLGLLLQARAISLHRRAAFEHVIARISTRFINTPSHELSSAIQWALEEMAACLGAERAYIFCLSEIDRNYIWTAEGVRSAGAWPDTVPRLVRRHQGGTDGILHVPRVTRLPLGATRSALAGAGIRSWACTFRQTADGGSIILGFDILSSQRRIAGSGELGLLRVALDAVGNAIGRRVLEQQREHLQARLQQARRLETVGALASGIAHNFNNIIAAILGYTEMADETADGAHVVPEIRRAAERARELVEQILIFARRRQAPQVPVDISSLAAESVSLLRASLPQDVAMSVRLTDEPAIVAGVQAQLQQVILNLCTNAAHAFDHGGKVELEVVVVTLDTERPLSYSTLPLGRYACIRVSDTGRGIEPAALERIFEPFFTTRIDGTGLGLATARDVVAEHNGGIDVRSQPGVGTWFEVWLPCTTATEPAAEDPEDAVPLGNGETILLVESGGDRLLRDEEILAALGYEPIGVAAPTGIDDILKATPEQFDAAILSACLPDVLGLCKALHERMRELPILLATASSNDIEADTMVTAGIRDVVPWPINSTELATALGSCLGRKPVPRPD